MSKFKSYPEYKDSGIEWLGRVPKSWRPLPLKRAVEGCVNGVWGDEPSGQGDIVVIRVADFDYDMGLIKSDNLTLRRISVRDYNSRALRRGDLLIEKSGGGEKTLVGRVVFYDHDFMAVTSNFVARLRPLEGFLSKYLYYVFFNLYEKRLNYRSIKQTTGIQNLDTDHYLGEYSYFPSYREQKQIACFLDHETARMDELIAEQKRLIELLKEKRQAVISHAVTKGVNPNAPMKDSGIEWLGEVPEHWQVVRLRFLCKIKTGDQDTQDAIDEGKYPFFVRSEKIQRSGKVTFEGEGVLTSGDGAGVGEIYHYFKGKMAIHQRVYLFYDFKRIVALFFFYYLRSQLKPVVLSQSAKSTVDSLRLPMLQNFVLCMPPKEEQMQIIERIDNETRKIDALIQEAEKAIELMKERRSALISAAVTGKIDVRDWQPEKEQVEALAS